MQDEVEVVTWRSPEVVERDAGRTAPNLRREPERGSQVDRVPGGIGRGHRTFRRARAVGEGSWLGRRGPPLRTSDRGRR